MALTSIDAHLELHNVDELPGRHHDRSYTLHEMVVTQGRAFLNLSSMNNDDPLKNDYFAYEFGGSGVKETLMENGKLTKDQEASFKTNFYNGMKSQGIDADRLTPIPAKDPENSKSLDPSSSEAFESVVENLLEKPSTITHAARLSHIAKAFSPTGLG